MPSRVDSPTPSEQDYDISANLIAEQSAEDQTLDFGSLLDSSRDATSIPLASSHAFLRGLVDDNDDDGDAKFIAKKLSTANRINANKDASRTKKSGGFQSMGLSANVLKAVTRKGFSVPTPIQRKTIPLIMSGQDVVGMARTGSGKTAAFVIPLIEKLRVHSVMVGARAIVLSPSRELALQTLKAVRDFGHGTDLRSTLLVGGDSLEEQFSQMTSNPDIIIATPGRFLHLIVEMSLDMSSAKYVVFDEADRLFEMGFASQLTEILHSLPSSRQTLLFSATLPASLVEFAKAGLQEPQLVRLDAESKVSPDLQSAFLSVKSSDKAAALLHLLNDVIKMPIGAEADVNPMDNDAKSGKKRKRKAQIDTAIQEAFNAYSTIIFAATKHHVEYLAHLLQSCGFAVSYVYGALDQTARHMQVENFRSGKSKILVVTDVAARGVDIPLLANVINYDFPSQPKIFVHRVGRTARAGRSGWSYSLVQDSDLPYLLDLQLFLGRELKTGKQDSLKANFAEDMYLGRIPTVRLERNADLVSSVMSADDELEALRLVAMKGEKLYRRTRNSASSESAKRARKLHDNIFMLESNVIYQDEADTLDATRHEMLAKISGFRPVETVFEIGRRGQTTEAAEVVRKRREIQRRRHEREEALASSTAMRNTNNQSSDTEMHDFEPGSADHEEINLSTTEFDDENVAEDEDQFELAIGDSDSLRKAGVGTVGHESWQDSEHFMSYEPKQVNMAEERGYGVASGSNGKDSNFVDAARGVTMDLNNDESKSFAEPSRAKQMRWDKKSKRYVSKANDEDGSRGKRMIKGESGQKIAASFRSGRFDAWKKANRFGRMPRSGEAEMVGTRAGKEPRKKFKHYAERAPKRPDKYRDDYHKKVKRAEEAKDKGKLDLKTGKSELRSVEDVRKQRNLKERRRDKNARPARKKG